ncbi:MAG TPA: MBL fold metallo-hydrolase [Gemmatales bacterium]|nr:MBL fold metallo-hydrolase [Gemmatales bacterium]
MNRRRFLQSSAAALAATSLPLGWRRVEAGSFRLRTRPRLTFYGSNPQVSGSCHLLETTQGLYVIDCGLFMSDVRDAAAENRELPFDPKEVKAMFLTHAHVDHMGRIPLLYKRGFRGKIYCTDCTRDLTAIMLDSGPRERSKEDIEDMGGPEDAEGALGLLAAQPYNSRVKKDGLEFRFTDAGHILGSAMVEVWADGAKVLFGGDMGPSHSPILCRATQHFGADAVLVESTYGPVPTEPIDFQEFGRKLQKVIDGGGSVLIPAFALHKTQIIIYILHRLIREKILDSKVYIYSDSSTAQKCTKVYNDFREYYDPEAKKEDKLFYKNRYREMSGRDSLETHGNAPAIYISTSGMLDHANAPKHLVRMADNEKNACFVVGYQAPNSVGRKLLNGEKRIKVPVEEEGPDGKFFRDLKDCDIKLQVEKISGFSSHAPGQEILEWVAGFKEIGELYVVHGDEDRSTGLAEAAARMGVNAVAPKRGETFEVIGERVKPGSPPKLTKKSGGELAPVDK